MIELEDQQVPEPVLVGARKGGLEIYGPGTDGDVTVTGPISLSRDMYYNNLTVLANAQIDTNGYRIFVKDTLYLLDPTSVIGRLSEKSLTGTLMGGAISGVKASDTLGGNGGLNAGENFFGEAEFYNFSQAIAGYKFDAVRNTLRFLMGGSGGLPGNRGADGTAGTGQPGSPGAAGSTGAPGNRPGYENVVGVPGGKGYSGNPGGQGNAGIGGPGGIGGDGGLGGTGGGVVIVSARKIIGSGIIRADGDSPGVIGEGTPGLPGTPGNAGASGTAGDKAPDFFQGAYTYTIQNAYSFQSQFTTFGTRVESQTNYQDVLYTASNAYNFIAGYTTYGIPGNEAFYRFLGFFRNSYTVPGNPPFVGTNPPVSGRNPPTTGRNPPSFGTNPPTPGPVRVRRFPGNPFVVPGTSFTIPGNPYTIAGNPYTIAGNTAYTAFNTPAPFSNPPTPYFNPKTYGYNTEYGTVAATYAYYTNSYRFSYLSPFRIIGFNTEFSPEIRGFEPSIYHDGGLGGAAGTGGAGGTASAGLPGQPGTSGYAGGGGVVLLVTESDIPQAIEVRSAAGTGDGGLATAGTVIIIKNEEEVV
jgi:hypothetical protein